MKQHLPKDSFDHRQPSSYVLFSSIADSAYYFKQKSQPRRASECYPVRPVQQRIKKYSYINERSHPYTDEREIVDTTCEYLNMAIRQAFTIS